MTPPSQKISPFSSLAKKLNFFVFSSGLAISGFSTAQELKEPANAESIMQNNTAITKFKDSISIATMTLVDRDGDQRVRKVAGHTRLVSNAEENMRLIRFLGPADIKGTATLLIENAATDDDIWIYLPALGKVRRLSSANKKTAYVGTDFSYGDVVGYKVSEWAHEIVREDVFNHVRCYVIESKPKNDAARQNSGYSKRTSWISKENYVAVKIEISDLDGQPLKTISSSAIQEVSKNRWQAMESEVKNVQTGHKTILKYQEFKTNQNVPEKLFTVRELEQ
jgi:outer membrane lipoprotein-sorting protein